MTKPTSMIFRLTIMVAIILLTITINGKSDLAYAQSAATSVEVTQLLGQPTTEYRARRQKLMEKITDGIVVLFGQEEDSELGVDSKFRQYDNFMYLTGVEVPGSMLILVPNGNKGAREWLFIPPRNLSNERWTGPQPDPNPTTATAWGVEQVVSTQSFASTLEKILKSEDAPKTGTTIYTVIPPKRSALFREQEFVEQMPKSFPNVKMAPIATIIADLRMIKSDSEIALMRRAIEITATAQADVANSIKPNIFEYELEGTILGNFYRGGAQRAAFPCIVGSGINSTILHYENNHKKIEDGDLVVVDIGAEYNYYAADITRTYPANGHFTNRQRDIYKLVLEAQTAAATGFKPGKSTMFDLYGIAIKTMRDSALRDSHGQTLDRYFIHGLGHFVGMYVHDVGDYSRPLPNGAIITIEPGIYLPDEKLGVRIEDEYLVTSTGLVKLSKNIPNEPDEIEKLLGNPKSK